MLKRLIQIELDQSKPSRDRLAQTKLYFFLGCCAALQHSEVTDYHHLPMSAVKDGAHLGGGCSDRYVCMENADVKC